MSGNLPPGFRINGKNIVPIGQGAQEAAYHAKQSYNEEMDEDSRDAAYRILIDSIQNFPGVDYWNNKIIPDILKYAEVYEVNSIELVEELITIARDNKHADKIVESLTELKFHIFCFAIENYKRDDFDRLLASNPDFVNKQSESGYTALMLAAGTGRLDMVKELLEKGADTSIVNHKDKEGPKTAAMYAYEIKDFHDALYDNRQKISKLLPVQSGGYRKFRQSRQSRQSRKSRQSRRSRRK